MPRAELTNVVITTYKQQQQTWNNPSPTRAEPKVPWVWEVDVLVTRRHKMEDHIRMIFNRKADADAVFRHVYSEMQSMHLAPKSPTAKTLASLYNKFQ